MKKHTLEKFLCICLSGTLLSGCSNAAPTDNSAPETDALSMEELTEGTAAETEPAVETVPLTEPTTQMPTEIETETRFFRVPAEWEYAYRTLLEPYLDTEASFSLLDVIGDRTPELFFADEQLSQDSLCQVYTYTETDGLVYIGEMDFGGEISLNMMNGYILHSISNDGYYFYSAQEITDDYTLKVLITLVLDDSAGSPVRYINDEIVSEEEFDSALEEYGFHSDLIRLGLRHDITEEEINTAISHSYAPPAF